MSRIKSITKNEAKEPVKTIYTEIEKKLGKIPNIFLNMGNSPVVLQGFLALSDAASHTNLSPQLREEIALIVAETNKCNYCLAAHTTIAQGAGLSLNQTLEARKGSSSDLKNQAILHFTKRVVETKGLISDHDVTTLKTAHISDTELTEIILVIMVNMFTNYFNHITDPAIDFPEAPKL